uniref:Brca1 interacting protein helicase 1 brip1 n=1 Tax=Solanum tuberosum TaxID=4113 RepID=M1DQI7_SOLTU
MVIPSRGLQPSVIQLHEPVPGYVIEGVSVEFPYRPYFPQIGVIRIVLRTLCRTEAASSLHSLIEVPAGIGKSLALLCAALSWQQRLKDNSHSQAPASGTSFRSALTDLNPYTAPPAANNANKIPAIYYASRTHAQLSQVVGEYQKTGLIMAVLDLRKHCCTNENLQGHADIDMECKGLLKNWEAGCSEFKNIQKVKDDSTLKKGGCYEVHAIEDLVQVGKHVKACSMANDAELVFCPYSYIINPVIRRALDVNIEGSILIIDESHNIEDICHDVGSVDVGMKCLNEHKVLDASSRSFFAHAKLHMLGLMVSNGLATVPASDVK